MSEVMLANGKAINKTIYKRNLFAILISVLVVGVTISMSLQLLSLIMDQRGYGTDMIGLHAAMSAVAILSIGPFVPKMMSRPVRKG